MKNSQHNLELSEDYISPVQPWKKVQVSTKRRIPDSEDDNDEDQALNQPQKKIRVGTKRNSHCSPADEGADDASEEIRPRHKLPSNMKNKKKQLTGQSKKSSDSHEKDSSHDSDIELIEKPKETPEEELSMYIQ